MVLITVVTLRRALLVLGWWRFYIIPAECLTPWQTSNPDSEGDQW